MAEEDTSTTVTDTTSGDPEVTESAMDTDGDPEVTTDESPWYSKLSDEYKDNDVVKGFETPEALVKAYLDKPDAPETIKAEDYKLPDGFNLDGFRDFAHNTGLSQDQVNKSLEFYNQVQSAEGEAREQVNQQALDRLLTSWGNEKDGNISLAKRALVQFDTDKTMSAFLEETRAGNNPFVVQFLYQAGKMLEEDGYLKSQVTAPPSNKSTADVLYPEQGKGE